METETIKLLLLIAGLLFLIVGLIRAIFFSTSKGFLYDFLIIDALIDLIVIVIKAIVNIFED